VRFDYVPREVDPLPGESGLQLIYEPIIPVRFVGVQRTYLIRGLVDTGASITLIPRSFMTKLGLGPRERVKLRTPAGSVQVWLAALDLELRSGRMIYRWSAQVGFIPRADNVALLGHSGFLDHFPS
jgi:Aspartyl protease